MFDLKQASLRIRRTALGLGFAALVLSSVVQPAAAAPLSAPGLESADPTSIMAGKQARGGKTNSFDANCDETERLIKGYEQLLRGQGVLGGAANLPGIREEIQSDLKDAKKYKEEICDTVRAKATQGPARAVSPTRPQVAK